MAQKLAPYGTWTSPITAELITQSTINITDVLVDPVTGAIYHLEERPSEEGRAVVVETRTGQDVFGHWSARTGVQEYGGAAVTAYGGFVYFSHVVDNRVYRVKKGEAPEAVTPDYPSHRFADFAVHPRYPSLLVAILEDHTKPEPANVVTQLCIIDTDAKSVTPVVSGADFYAVPRFSPSGTHLTWQQWFHPDMPWEGAEIHIAPVTVQDGQLHVAGSTYVAGKRKEISATYPFWCSDDLLIFTSDEAGYHNPWTYRVSADKADALLPTVVEEDFSEAAWWLGGSYGAPLDDGTALLTAFRDGRSVLYIADVRNAALTEVDCPYVNVEHIRHVGADQVVFVATAADAALPSAIISLPQPLKLSVPPDDEPVHVVFYPPTNPEYAGSDQAGEKPPCVVNVHGGPNWKEYQWLDWIKQYFTSRGWAWLDVNYGGSTGYGRKYLDRLLGKWGIVDVQDCVRASRLLAAPPYSLIDPARVVIRGASAGGYTVLEALSTFPDAFAAGTSNYGVSDVAGLANDTHKYESHYMEKMMAGTPAEIPEVYKARSPIYHAEKIKSPLLIIHGKIDPIVPYKQAEEIAQNIRRRVGRVDYVLFEDEGHIWQKAKNIKFALEREIGFYEGVLGLRK
ncbi:alpha/beta-hydrolase [Gloeophyllum trabeum ATCC 11539]|uniref:Alpha/beta-hydrolase n=1 Tax=Gloeophyllum trabeum (strain ATCC 11539 / FP-39264 / Madison 617) TaxID=670483 RepID=S7Q056_GLOTA|nr:alpha/beta-hydrolase [Gloeophyllum trabeum ATCC 11539]EPQ53311.1 alpha/beta-hydrolase [Gloeophyllum trabeum ATCC 11539]